MSEEPIRNPALVSQLCVTCGICCGGVLHPFAILKPGEADFAQGLGFDVFENKTENESGHNFRLPCRFLNGTACGIYGQPRPYVCGAYFCQLARTLDEGGISFDDAAAKVSKAHRLIADIRHQLEPGEEISDAFGKLGPDQAKSGEKAPTPRLKLLLATLTMLFDRHFRPRKKVAIKRSRRWTASFTPVSPR